MCGRNWMPYPNAKNRPRNQETAVAVRTITPIARLNRTLVKWFAARSLLVPGFGLNGGKVFQHLAVVALKDDSVVRIHLTAITR